VTKTRPASYLRIYEVCHAQQSCIVISSI